MHAIRGNVDRGEWAASLPTTERVAVAGRTVYLIHNRHDPDVSPNAAIAGADVIISGHSHRASHELRDGVSWLNPGSIGPRRFGLPISMVWLSFGDPDQPPQVEFVTFDA